MANPDYLESNKRLVLDYFHDVVASFDIRPLPRFIAENFALHGADDLVGITSFEEILLRDFAGAGPLAPEDVKMIPPAFVIAEGDLVTIAFYMPMADPDVPGQHYDYFGFNTYRVENGKIAERWSNEHRYARPQFLPQAAFGKHPTQPRLVGETDLEKNKQLVSDFYDQVFGTLSPDRVKDFVAQDYLQHSSHMPQGLAGLEAYVSELAAQAPELPEGAAPGSPPAPAVLHAEGDIVVIAAQLPQPLHDEPTGSWNYFAYDAYRVRDGKLAEHWSGIDKHARPTHP
ncbi:ester cyclase [Salinibacterium hongtaonis]|uniref:ester cyclase n=1 Tax=Homoserinimonas hongtaonis TaxID=2079791 RepID=UPI0018EFA093|nr:ester cyclase [Salinibacterium hongtaonis]